MSFWGVEVKPGKPYPYHSDNVQGRLCVTQATLGLGTSAEKCILQCTVGHKNPIFLCSLLPNKSECCPLNLEFKDDLVAFSVIGSRSIHISGFFVSDDGDNLRDEYDFDSGDDVTDSEESYDSSDEDEDNYEYMDFDDDAAAAIFPPSPAHKSGVVIEEIEDEDPAKDINGLSKQETRKKLKAKENESEKQVVKKQSSMGALESEDEDGFPVSASQCADGGEQDEKKQEKGDPVVKGKKRVSNDMVQGECIDMRKRQKEKESSLKDKSILNEPSPQDVKMAVSEIPNTNSLSDVDTEKKPIVSEEKKKRKNKRKKLKDETSLASAEGGSGKAEEDPKSAKPSHVRTFPNGMVIEDVKIGVPDGRRASDGSRVGVRYIGKLKKNGKIFDSNVSGRPFEFRLGVGEVIKGWDVGVKGMRVGDKRKLTIPPSMGYGSKGAGGKIPPNAWLEFDVELVNVR